ncbi:MAG: PqqD family protein [Clostridia bacterium]|nr:PqqD family protein [Clostridia bacterium]
MLELILGEYDVSREQASADLDALLAKLDGYGMLEY